MKDVVRCAQQHPVLYSDDLDETVAFYTETLGFDLGFRMETIVGLNFDQVSIHVAKGPPNPAGGQVYFVVSDVDAFFGSLDLPNESLLQAPSDQPYGMRDFAVRDNSGYRLSFGTHMADFGPPVDIQRSSFDGRLETRLLAVLQDLAAHKKMSLTELLEEIVLHSFEPLPDGGTASPHSEADLRTIEELKTKHGIDYGAHEAYRFREPE
ncbi:MAG: VOC family protein [Pseudomonadota bacterium]